MKDYAFTLLYAGLCLALPVPARALSESLYDKGDGVYDATPLAALIEEYRQAGKVNIIVKPAEKQQAAISMHAKAIPKFAILQYAARALGLNCRFESYGAVFEPPKAAFPARAPDADLSAALMKKFSPQFEETALMDVFQFLAQVQGVNLVFVAPETWKNTKVTIKLGQTSALQFLGYIDEFYHVPFVIDKWAVIVGEKRTIVQEKKEELIEDQQPAKPAGAKRRK